MARKKTKFYRTTIFLKDKEIWNKFKIKAIEENKTITDVLTELIGSYIKNSEKGGTNG